MKATEFCKFFDFTLYKENGIDEDGHTYNYIATDDQGCWGDRTGTEITDIVNWFDVCLMDYVDDNLECNGFEYVPEAKENYYEQALKWCDSIDGIIATSDVREVVACLVDPSLIEDDAIEEDDI